MAGKVRKHIWLTKPQDKAINKLSEDTGLKPSELFRRAIDSYLDDINRRTRELVGSK